MPFLLCFFLQVGQGFTMEANKTDSNGSLGKEVIIAPLVNSADVKREQNVEKSGSEQELQSAYWRTAVLENPTGLDDDLLIASSSNTSMGQSTGLVVKNTIHSAPSSEMTLPTPPPDGVTAVRTETLLVVASNTPPEYPEKNKPKSAPEPKTSKNSSISTPVLVGAGLAVIAGVAVAAGGGSGSDSSSDSGTATSTTTAPATGATDVINLSDLVRIGDDNDYNANHPDKFKVSHPSGTSWADTFSIDNFYTVKSAKFSYTVAASKVGNPIYINGRQAGRLCNPGNTAWNVEACSVDITSYIRAGSNEIKIKCAIDPSDTVTPLDDVELYTLRIELTR